MYLLGYYKGEVATQIDLTLATKQCVCGGDEAQVANSMEFLGMNIKARLDFGMQMGSRDLHSPIEITI